ncbi:hypothetical protein SpCBS45565_g05256 [Spizellomyces sp. 'palustris']|nr:hypothetical protein SpCBS45565_g05256 [Spizellomyces sp. 'palustris']
MSSSFYTLHPQSSGSRNASIPPVDQLWGFDPLQLLETVEFPNDRYEKYLRRNKAARMMAIRRIPLPVTPPTSETSTPISTKPSTAATLPSSTSHQMSQHHLRRSILSPASTAIRDEATLREQLARLAATLLIQAMFRGWRTRTKYIAVVYAKVSVQTHRLSPPDVVGAFQRELPGVNAQDLSVQEKLLRRYYKYCSLVEAASPIDTVPPTFPEFAAAYIQAVWRMWLVRRNWLRFRRMKSGAPQSDEAEEARKEMLWKARKAGGQQSTWDEAARKIQRAWRGYYNVKIYRFHRDLIRFRLRGDPRKLLRFINPQESQLIDGAMGIHVKFRLGGTAFPPTIYYKIFVHKNLVDMNAFSPRDYTSQESKQLLPVDIFDRTGPLPKPGPLAGWYQRIENNGWRPVSEKMLDEPQDIIPQLSNPKPIRYHHLQLKRRQDLEAAKRMRKLEWLKKMYRQGKEMMQAAEQNLIQSGFEDDTTTMKSSGGPVMSDQTYEQIRLPLYQPSVSELELTPEAYLSKFESELDADVLIRWTNALDFDTYCADWIEIATSGKSDDPTTFDIEAELTVEDAEAMKRSVESETAVHDGDDDILERHTASASKSRPWSGKSDRSVRDLMVSQRDILEF